MRDNLTLVKSINTPNFDINFYCKDISSIDVNDINEITINELIETLQDRENIPYELIIQLSVLKPAIDSIEIFNKDGILLFDLVKDENSII